MPTLSVDDLIAFHNATGCPLADARRLLVGVEPELQERILIAARARKSKNLELKDPIEQDPVIRLKVRQTGRGAEDQVSYQSLGRCLAVLG
jgi:hypothetical protein